MNDYALFVLLRRQKIARGFASDRPPLRSTVTRLQTGSASPSPPTPGWPNGSGTGQTAPELAKQLRNRSSAGQILEILLLSVTIAG